MTIVYPGVLACACGAPNAGALAIGPDPVESDALEPFWCAGCGVSMRDVAEENPTPRYAAVCPACETPVRDLDEHLRAHTEAPDRRVDE